MSNCDLEVSFWIESISSNFRFFGLLSSAVSPTMSLIDLME